MKHYQNHEFAGLLPATADDDYHRIREDIRTNGLRVPIILFQGKILDGRTRYRACIELSKTPRFDVFRGTEKDALRHVATHNLYRRHLDASQKAMAGQKLAEYLEKIEGLTAKQATRQAAITVNVSPRSVEKAKRIVQEQPEDVSAIINGHKTINEVDVEIRARYNPLANVQRRLLDVASATQRLGQAVFVDMRNASKADVDALEATCENIRRSVDKAERIIERVSRELTEDET